MSGRHLAASHLDPRQVERPELLDPPLIGLPVELGDDGVAAEDVTNQRLVVRHPKLVNRGIGGYPTPVQGFDQRAEAGLPSASSAASDSQSTWTDLRDLLPARSLDRSSRSAIRLKASEPKGLADVELQRGSTSD